MKNGDSHLKSHMGFILLGILALIYLYACKLTMKVSKFASKFKSLNSKSKRSVFNYKQQRLIDDDLIVSHRTYLTTFSSSTCSLVTLHKTVSKDPLVGSSASAEKSLSKYSSKVFQLQIFLPRTFAHCMWWKKSHVAEAHVDSFGKHSSACSQF